MHTPQQTARVDPLRRALRVIEHPGMPVANLPRAPYMQALWRCECGIEFEKSYQAVAETGVKCRYCISYGQSRFEHEVLYCLQLMLPRIEIKSNFTKQGYTKYVDLYFPQFDLAVELDPFMTHRHTPERDVRVLERIRPYYQQVVRVRDERLPHMPGSITVPEMSGNAAKLWAQLVTTIPQLRRYVVDVPEIYLDHALDRACNDWRGQVARPERPLSLEQNAELAFVQNMTRPGRQPAFIHRASSDSCLWRCTRADCDNQYKQRVFRWVHGIRCPLHRGDKLRTGHNKRWRHANIATVAPEIYGEMRAVVGQPGVDLSKLSFASRVMCLWACGDCGLTYEMSPGSRRKGASCPHCRVARMNGA